MRRSRWLFLAAILLIVVAVGETYLKNVERFRRGASAPPAALDANIDLRDKHWHYDSSDGSHTHVYIQADNMRELKDPAVMELEGVELKLYNKAGTQYDFVQSKKAQFSKVDKVLFSDGDVEITLDVPASGPPRARQLKILGSGVRVQSETGVTSTDRKVSFLFDRGGGSAVGADYDPSTGEVHLHSQVSLDWQSKTPDAKPMHIDCGQAVYREKESKVILYPWSKLTRDTLTLEGGMGVIHLEKGGAIELAEIEKGHGTKADPDRKVEFGADQLNLNFADHNLVSKIDGERNARLISTSASGRTTVTGDKLNLDFATDDKDSTLSAAIASGKSVAESVPAPKPNGDTPETRILRSDTIRMKMRPGGKDLESVETAGAATLDFLPNRPDQPKRQVKGSRVWITYGSENRIQSFRSVDVWTQTNKPPAKPGEHPPAPAFTQSHDLLASFDPKTSDLTHLDQKTNFHYDQGDRHAIADQASLDQAKDTMTLDGKARVWDPTQSTTADRIVMNQKSGDFEADGHVASTRMADEKSKPSAILSADEIMEARADRMVSTDDNKKILYEGKAIAWQGANRLSADSLFIDRDSQTLQAHGNVYSQFADKDKQASGAGTDAKTGKPLPVKAAVHTVPPIFTVVRAPEMVYTDETRLADYKGGVTLSRPHLSVSGTEIRAFLKDADQDSSLDHAVADGSVKIVSTRTPQRKRTGESDHAEYFAGEDKVVLEGGSPVLEDSYEGTTHGKQLTWWANDDRLRVDGVDKEPGKSRLRKK